MQPYQPKHKIRIVTAASLFDGHDAAINLMRRLMQSTGAEVIHLGHNRSASEIVQCAIQEDVQAIAVTSYQGGHMEFFKYMYDLLQENGCGHIRIFGGGGGTILPHEIEELHRYGITRIYSPDDGRRMGLQGMINDLMEKSDFDPLQASCFLTEGYKQIDWSNPAHIARLISLAENHPEIFAQLSSHIQPRPEVPVLGITGTGGSGKSSLIDEFMRRFLYYYPQRRLAVISVDPSKRKTGGALLGDRIRMNSADSPRVYMRSLATRQSNLALSRHVGQAIQICKAAGFDLVIVETSGIGQSDTEIVEYSDVSLYVMTNEFGAQTQLEKIDMLDFADLVAINKFDKRGSLDALRDVRKQYRRNHQLWDVPDEQLPIFGTIASQFNDHGTNLLFRATMSTLSRRMAERGISLEWIEKEQNSIPLPASFSPKPIIPPERTRYLAEICETLEEYNRFVEEQSQIARKMYQLHGVIQHLRQEIGKKRIQVTISDSQEQKTVRAVAYQQGEPDYLKDLIAQYETLSAQLAPECRQLLESWQETQQRYRADKYHFQVRDKVIEQDLYTVSLSGLKIPKVALPKYHDWGDLLYWMLTENTPGFFPYTAGVFPLKRQGEDPTRMFAGEGGPEKTNRRFHFLSKDMPAKRLSTAFDSVTLYGENPNRRPDIYGKIGNSGVSVATLDDAKKLYSGFNLCHPATSVSMTINGPAPAILAMFFNTAIDQQCEIYIRQNGLLEEVQQKLPLTETAYQGTLPEGNDGLGLLLIGTTGDRVLPPHIYEKIKAETLQQVRGTVQADILKEDQAQNTCIFSTEFALRMMGDLQQYFIDHKIQNFYSISISGYHIAEAGANPITQLAFTLANGFTYVEYFLSRGMHIDDFAPNLSFFFSNGMDPEYSVLGRVARRIWAKAIKYKYKGNSRSQKLKYHIQTSGRSLHAQEIAFNDIRTTLQALYAIYDNCNSLHTNAYDEAITTPTEESVRRALAIQLIINKELGLAKNENPLQGAFIIEELTNLVEEAVMAEFRALSERGGVLGAMERMYQRSKIQEESMYYETLKHSGKLPIIGVNTFLDPNGSPTVVPMEVRRSTKEEKEYAIASLQAFERAHAAESKEALRRLQQVALSGGNIFAELMETVKTCSLGQITAALYEVGGKYRRNM
ncbi:MAG: methylmalonyl-CoA mutase family protein [Cytophagales bacterium]|nr:methylmalonyl-CoA mutase family protein [Bernardetiaceae bacterium]MDW8211725.1 methylmalonyl-CoA mutase family protein [Cytophagales bacterium]